LNRKGQFRLFLFKPKAWYGITLWRVWNCRRRMASPMVHFLRLDSIQRFALIPYCLLTDSIHGFAVIKLGVNQVFSLGFLLYSLPAYFDGRRIIEIVNFCIILTFQGSASAIILTC
jgi:hypothetical protein